jgi:hypothetical protein
VQVHYRLAERSGQIILVLSRDWTSTQLATQREQSILSPLEPFDVKFRPNQWRGGAWREETARPAHAPRPARRTLTASPCANSAHGTWPFTCLPLRMTRTGRQNRATESGDRISRQNHKRYRRPKKLSTALKLGRDGGCQPDPPFDGQQPARSTQRRNAQGGPPRARHSRDQLLQWFAWSRPRSRA